MKRHFNESKIRILPLGDKDKILNYLKQRNLAEWASSARIHDPFTGDIVNDVCRITYVDGDFEWTSDEVYMFEKYNIYIDDELYNHICK